MAPDEPFGPLEAAAAIRTAESMDVMLRRRTSGLMWMLWGLVAPAIFLTFGFAESVVGGKAWWIPLLWMPWAGAGILATAMLWRSARLVLPAATQRPRSEIISHLALFLIVVVGGTWLVTALHAPVHPPAAALAGLGIVSMVFGLTGLLAVDTAERRVRFLTGALLLATAALASAAVAAEPREAAQHVLFVVGATAAAIAFYGSGLWLVLRG